MDAEFHSLDAELNSTSNEYPLCILFRRPSLIKNEDTLRQHVKTRFFEVSAFFMKVCILKSMHNGYSLDVEFNSASNECLKLKFE